MSTENSKKRTIKKKKLSLQQRRLRFCIMIALAVFLIMIVRIIPARTALVEYERKAFTENVKVYLFCDEEYVYLSSAEPVNFLPPAGTKISGSTLISDNYTVTTSEYTLQKLETVDYLLNNPDIGASELYAGITENLRLAAEYNALMNEAIKSGDADATARYAELLEKAQHDARLMKKALQFIFTQTESLSSLRDEYRSMIGTPQPLTAENLNFSVFGAISYSADGYENVMNMDMTDSVDGAYLNRLDGFTPVKQTAEGMYCVKSTSLSRAVAVVRLPADTELFCEDEAWDICGRVCSRYDIDREGGYFSFIFRRMDIYGAFPTVELTASDGTPIKGRLVKVDRGENEKILYIAITEGLAGLTGKRIFTAALTVQTYRCWVVDKRCVYEDGSKTYINMVSGSSEKIPTEVKVYRYLNGKAYIRVAENEGLYEGMEIMLKGRKIR